MKNKIRKGNYFMKIMSAIFLVSMLLVFGYFMTNVSIGQHIAKEMYISKDEWLWNVGIFLAIMNGFCQFFNSFNDMFVGAWFEKRGIKK